MVSQVNRRLCVRQIPRCLSYVRLWRHFGRYGQLSKLRLGRGKGKWRYYAVRRSACLEYVHRAGAVSALEAHRWRPTKRKAKPSKQQLQLNDDCIMAIMQRMSLQDQTRVVRLSQRSRDLYKRLTRSPAYRTCQLGELHTMTSLELLDYFQLTGARLTRLEGSLPPDYVMAKLLVELLEHCTLSIRSFRCMRGLVYIVDELVAALPNLVELHLLQCNIKDNFIICFAKLRALKHLDLSDNFGLTGCHLIKLTQGIEVLKLNSCISLRSRYVLRFLESAPAQSLRELQLEQIYGLDASLYNAMSLHCKSLETLHIACHNEDYAVMGPLPALKSLTLFGGGRFARSRAIVLPAFTLGQSQTLQFYHLVAVQALSDEHMEYFGRLQNLRTLVIPHNRRLTDGFRELCKLAHLEELVLSECVKLTNAALLDVVRCCSKLRALYIEGCVRINAKFVMELISLMKLYSARRQTHWPLAIMAERTSIRPSILKQPEYLDAQNLLVIYLKSNATTESRKWQKFYTDRYFNYQSEWCQQRYETDNFPRPMHQLLQMSELHFANAATE